MGRVPSRQCLFNGTQRIFFFISLPHFFQNNLNVKFLFWLKSMSIEMFSLQPNTCDHCLRPFSCDYFPHDPVICPISNVPYCTTECQQRAWDSYQRFSLPFSFLLLLVPGHRSYFLRVMAPHSAKFLKLKKEAEEGDGGTGVKYPLLACRVVAAAMQNEKWPGCPTVLNELHHLNPRHERLPPVAFFVSGALGEITISSLSDETILSCT